MASLKLELAALKSEQDIREDELLGQIASLQVGAGRAAGLGCGTRPGRRLRLGVQNCLQAFLGLAHLVWALAPCCPLLSPQPTACPR